MGTYCLVVSFPRPNHRALKHPPQALLSFQNFVSRHEMYASQHSNQEQGAKTPPSPSGAEVNDVEALATMSASTQSNFSMFEISYGKNKLTCALVAEQSRKSPARSGSTAAMERVMAEGSKKGSKDQERRGERRSKKRKSLQSSIGEKRRGNVWQRVWPPVQPSLSNTVSLALRCTCLSSIFSSISKTIKTVLLPDATAREKKKSPEAILLFEMFFLGFEQLCSSASPPTLPSSLRWWWCRRFPVPFWFSLASSSATLTGSGLATIAPWG